MCSKLVCFELVQKDGEGDGGGREEGKVAWYCFFVALSTILLTQAHLYL